MRIKSKAPKREVATNIQKIQKDEIKTSILSVCEILEEFEHEIVVKCTSRELLQDTIKEEFQLNDTLFRMLVDIIELNNSYVIRLKRR